MSLEKTKSTVAAIGIFLFIAGTTDRVLGRYLNGDSK